MVQQPRLVECGEHSRIHRLSASTDRCLLQELKPDPSPMQHELVKTPIKASEGFVQVPTGDGLGVEVNEAVLRKYAY